MGNGTGTTKKFPPLTPQDLMTHNIVHDIDVPSDHSSSISSNKTLPIADDSDNDSMEDMELEDLTGDGQSSQLQRQDAKYIELDSSTNDTTKANGKFGSVGSASMSMSIPFRFNYDSANSADDNGMSLGDLETVKEEQSKSNYAMFVGLDSDQTTDTSQTSSINLSLQDAFKGFQNSNSSKTASIIEHKKKRKTKKKESPK